MKASIAVPVEMLGTDPGAAIWFPNYPGTACRLGSQNTGPKIDSLLGSSAHTCDWATWAPSATYILESKSQPSRELDGKLPTCVRKCFRTLEQRMRDFPGGLIFKQGYLVSLNQSSSRHCCKRKEKVNKQQETIRSPLPSLSLPSSDSPLNILRTSLLTWILLTGSYLGA